MFKLCPIIYHHMKDHSTESNAFSKSRNINSQGMLRATVWFMKPSINLMFSPINLPLRKPLRNPVWSCYRRSIKKTALQVLSLCVFLNFRNLTKYFAQIYRAQYGAAIMVFLRGTPTRPLENNVSIWNLLSKRLIICNTLTSENLA